MAGKSLKIEILYLILIDRLAKVFLPSFVDWLLLCTREEVQENSLFSSKCAFTEQVQLISKLTVVDRASRC